MQRGIEGAFFQVEDVFRHLLNVNRDPVAVHPPTGSKSLEYQKIESSLEAIVRVLTHGLPIASYGR